MFIQLIDIQNKFSDLKSRKNKPDHQQSPFCLDKYLVLTSSADLKHCNRHSLYVTTDLQMARTAADIENCCLLYLTEDLQNPCLTDIFTSASASVLLLETTDSQMVYERLQEFFDQQYAIGFLSDSLLEILFFEGGIQAMLEKVYPAFLNPIYVFDSNFSLIASTWDASKDKEQGQQIVEQGGFTEKEYLILNQSNTHRRMMQSEFPIRTKHPVYGYEQLLCAIDTKKDMGHIVLNGLNHEISRQDEHLLYLLKKAIDQQMKKDEFIRNNRGFHHEYFLRDLLDGKLTVQKHYSKQLNYVNTEFFGILYCMVIETARSSLTLNTMHIRSLFETEFPDTLTLMYNGAIVILFRLKSASILPSTVYNRIRQVCLEYGLYAGMGNCFSDIFDIPEYYHQALRAIELGVCSETQPGLFLYSDYYLKHLFNLFTQKESSETFCHPQLKILLDYDQTHDTNLSLILYTWLTCERNMAAASNMLYMHRNTLIYRLKKIHSLIQVDYENYAERQHIILSYEMYENEGKLPLSETFR